MYKYKIIASISKFTSQSKVLLVKQKHLFDNIGRSVFDNITQTRQDRGGAD